MMRLAIVNVLLFLIAVLPLDAQQDKNAVIAHLQKGNSAYANDNLSDAALEYEACLDVDPSEAGCIINLASVLVDLGSNNERAEKLYRQALAADPSNGDAAFNLALMLQDRKSEETTKEAADLYRVAVTADPSRWDAWANMATALVELKNQPIQAIRAFERSILIIEEATHQEGENPERDAYLSKLYYGYGTTLSQLTPELCAILANHKNSLLIGSIDKKNGDDGSDVASDSSLCKENAQNAMRTAAILDATNVHAAHMLAAMVAEDSGDDGVHRRATPEFVAALFDDFADTFDEKLGSLEYRVPGIIGAAASKVVRDERNNDMFTSALDAGCGTGLAGRYLRSLVAGPLIGVDISTKMLDIARKCTVVTGCGAKDQTTHINNDGKRNENESNEEMPLYDGLVALDLEVMTLEQTLLAITPLAGLPTHATSSRSLKEESDGFDLVVAADVLVYFGRLDSLLGNFARLSVDDATLIFSCERALPEDAPLGWRLLSSGRFSHTKEYVLKSAEALGYSLRSYEEIVPRMERGNEVQGHLFYFVLENRGRGLEDEL